MMNLMDKPAKQLQTGGAKEHSGMAGSDTSPYSVNNRVYLVFDALVGLINYYPQRMLSIYPLIDNIKLLVQHPLVFSFLNKQMVPIYCSMKDPQYTDEINALLLQTSNQSEKIRFKPIHGNDIYYLVIHLQSYNDKTDHLNFEPATSDILESYKKLFSEIESDDHLNEAFFIALKSHNDEDLEHNSKKINPKQPPKLSEAEYNEQIGPVRSVLDDALGELSGSPLLHHSPDKQDKQKKDLPFPNIFFVVQHATDSENNRIKETTNDKGETIQTKFDYTAQILLSNTQIESINKWCKEICKELIKSHLTKCCPSVKNGCPFTHATCLIEIGRAHV